MRLMIALLVAISVPHSLSAEEDKSDPILGVWRGFGYHRVVEFSTDGTFTLLPDARSKKGQIVGTWKQIESKSVERKYEVSWYQGKFIHVMTMNRSTDKMKGDSSAGGKIDAVKLISLGSGRSLD